MKRRRLLPALAGWGGSALAAGCGGGRLTPTTLALRLSADTGVNPDRAGAPKPLRVRVLQLAGATRLSQADFFALDADPVKALGPEFLAVEDVVVGPGQTASLEPEAKPGVKFVGVVGAYFAVDRARWRAWASVESGAANAYAARFGPSEVTLAGARA